MAARDPAEQTRVSRVVSLGAVMFAILAPLLFVTIFFLVTSIGYATAGRTLAPFAIIATIIGLVFSVWALFLPRSRVVGVATSIVIVPCSILAVIAGLSLLSPA